MKIGFLGAGAVGGWFGGRLAQAGHDVTFIARGETLEVLRTEGLYLNDEQPLQVNAVGSVADAGELDVLLLAVKVTAETDIAQLLDGLDEKTIVAVTQNSVEVPRLVASVVGQERTWPGVIRGYLIHTGPARVEHHGGPKSFTFGTWDGSDHPLLEQLADAINSSGNDGIVHPDIWVDVWEKAMFVTSSGALGALVGKELGYLRTELRSTLEGTVREIYNAGKAFGANLTEDSVRGVMEFGDNMPANVTTSMQRDIAEGLSNELDSQVGAVCRVAEEFDVAVPLLDLYYTQLSDGGPA